MSQYPNRGSGGHQGGGHRSGTSPRQRGDDGQDPDDLVTITLQGIAFGGQLAADLFSDKAEEAAKKIAGAGKDLNKASQLRRFYDELVMWHDKVGNDKTKFADCEPFIRMLKAKVAYARGRRHVDANFRALVDRLIDQSTDAETLRQARLFFEAFMAYYKVYRKQ